MRAAEKLVPTGRPESLLVGLRLATLLATRNRPEDIDLALRGVDRQQRRLRPGSPVYAVTDLFYGSVLLPQYVRFRRDTDLADALDRIEGAVGVLDRATAVERPDPSHTAAVAAAAAMARVQLAAALTSRMADESDGDGDGARIRDLLAQVERLSPEVAPVARVVAKVGELRELAEDPAVSQTFAIETDLPFPVAKSVVGSAAAGIRAGGRYHHGGDMTALDEEIAALEAQVDDPHRHEIDPASDLVTLAHLYQLRSRTKSLSGDSSAAVDRGRAEMLARQAIAAGGGSHDVARIVLANCKLDGYRPDSQDQHALDEALTLLRRAISGQSLSPAIRRASQSFLAEALIAKGYRDGDINDVDEAVSLFTMLRDRYVPGTISHAIGRSRLAAALHLQAEATGTTEDLLRAADESRQAVAAVADTSLIWAYDTALLWAEWSWRHERTDDAGEAYLLVVEMLNRLVRAQLTRAMSERVLRRAAPGMLGRAAYALTRRRRLREAVEVLEGGRAVLLSAALERDLIGLTAPEHAAVRERYLRAVEDLRVLEDRAVQQELAAMEGGEP